MNPEEQRVRIAEWMGFEAVNAVCWRGHLNGIETRVPDYCNDLNAMHAAKARLSADQLYRFAEILSCVMDRKPRHIDGLAWCAHFQMAEAQDEATALCRLLHPDD